MLDEGAVLRFQLDRFGDFLTLEQGTSPRTLEAYRRDVERLVDVRAHRRARTSPVDVTSRMLREFVYHLKDLGLAPASIRRNISAVRTYFRFLLADGVVARDPSERLETPKRWRTLPDVLTVDEIERLLAAPTLDDPLAFRDRAMLELAYGAGLRVSEWITLGVRDVLFEDKLVRVFGKGSKERLVPIGRSAIGAVATYVRELRPRLEKGRREGRSVPQRARRAAHAHGRLEDPAAVRRAGGDHEARLAAHAAALVRDASARGRRRPARRAGDARPRRHLDDADLHARRPGVPAAGAQAVSSASLSGRISRRHAIGVIRTARHRLAA